MCGQCFSFVQFPGILPTDTAPVCGNGSYPGGWTVDDLVNHNPQFFWAFGDSGVQTLHSSMVVAQTDLEISVTRGLDTITATAKPVVITDHPIHAPH